MAIHTYTTADAWISKCGTYRYQLSREWIKPGAPLKSAKTLLFIMLNPSTADGKKDDPTIRRCVSFAKNKGASRLLVANLFAYRATEPFELKSAVIDCDIIGPEFWDYFSMSVRMSDTIVVGWGTNGSLLKQDEIVMEYLKQHNRKAYCLGTTMEGFPKHPLYIRRQQKLIPYSGR